MQETMDHILKKIIGVKEQQEICQQKKEELELKKIQELKKLEEELREKYRPSEESIIQEMSQLNKEVETYSQKIKTFSTFPSGMIGEIFADLLTIYEGEPYCFQKTKYRTKKIKTCTFDRVEVDVIKNIAMIIKEENMEPEYHYPFHNPALFAHNGEIIVLDECEKEDTLGDEICFYEFNSSTNQLSSYVRFGRFDYVKEFIDFVIDFRIKNNQLDIDVEEMQGLLKQFFNQKKEEIKANYQLRLAEKKEQASQQYEEARKHFQKQLHSIYGNN